MSKLATTFNHVTSKKVFWILSTIIGGIILALALIVPSLVDANVKGSVKVEQIRSFNARTSDLDYDQDTSSDPLGGLGALEITINAPSNYRIFYDFNYDNTPRDNRIQRFNIGFVDSQQDCSDFNDNGADSTDFDNIDADLRLRGQFAIHSRRPSLVKSAFDISDYIAAVYDADDSDDGIDGKYACVEAVYQIYDEDENDDPEYHYLSSTDKISLERPTLERVRSQDSEFTAEHVGNQIQMELEFDQPVRAVKVKGQGKNKPYFNYAMGRYPAHQAGACSLEGNTAKFEHTASSDYSEHLVFQYELDFRDCTKDLPGDRLDEDDVRLSGSIPLILGDYIILNEYGVVVLGANFDNEDNRNLQVTPNDDYRGARGFDITIDTTPIITLSRSGRDLVASADPTRFTTDHDNDQGDGQDGTTKPKRITTIQNGDKSFSQPQTVTDNTWRHVVATSEDIDPDDEDDACHKYIDREDAQNNLDSDELGEESKTRRLPSAASNNYYCFTIKDVYNRDASSTWYHYSQSTTSTQPHLQLSYANNILTVTTRDSSIGLSSVSWKYINSATASCQTSDSGFTQSSPVTNGLARISVASNQNGRFICIKTTDNNNRSDATRHTLRYVANTNPNNPFPQLIVSPNNPVTPTSTSPPSSTTTSPAQPSQPTTETDVVLPADWASLSVPEKIRLNPYGCHDTRKIRDDNGQCLSGGSTRPTNSQPEVEDPQPTEVAPEEESDSQTVAPEEDQQPAENQEEPAEQAASPVNLQINVNPSSDNNFEISTNDPDEDTSRAFEYAIFAGQDSCLDVDNDQYQSLTGQSVSIADYEDEQYICVRTKDANDRFTYSTKKRVVEARAVAEAGDGEATPPPSDGNGQNNNDDDGGGSMMLIIAGVLAVLIIGIIIFIVASNKKNKQQF
ncbi:MAG: hypothetical protein OXF30_00065 [Candidatus Saccharibacteria bacterium]|nr:hypothetical protein [Candidatus Saccharibacteria bacterium]